MPSLHATLLDDAYQENENLRMRVDSLELKIRRTIELTRPCVCDHCTVVRRALGGE